MFIYVSYSANIVVLLQSTTKINDVQELLDSRIEVGGCQIHYMKNYFEVFCFMSVVMRQGCGCRE
jgi:hypothetical protein